MRKLPTRLTIIGLSIGLAVGVLAAREPSFEEYRTIQDSLSSVHPRMRASWLRERGFDDSYYTTFRKPESTGLRCIGRWPWGPSWELCGLDSLLFLGSGSGVRILSISDSTHPRMLGQINARGLINELEIHDTLLYVACGSWGAQVYSVADPANPRELGSMDGVTGDLTVLDTLCYAVGGDSFRIHNVADPTQPEQLSVVCDTGNFVAVVNNHAFLGGRRTMNVYDVGNPSAPTWINSRGGAYLVGVPRRNLLFCSGIQPAYFSVLDVSDPLSITTIGQVGDYGGHQLLAGERFAYLSCTDNHRGLHVIDIADSTNPQVRGSYNPEGTEEYDSFVYSESSYGYLAAHYGGLVVLDLHDENAPVEVWAGCKAHQAVDVDLDGGLAYVANEDAGLRILDVSDPTRPVTIGDYDTIGILNVRSCVARDSFAFSTYQGINRRYLRVLDVTDPANPQFAAEESARNRPEDLVLRDSLVYAAEINEFQVFNVARPREPGLVGSCLAGDANDVGLSVTDTLAFIGNFSSQVVNIADPTNPEVVGTFGRGAWNVSVRDTFAFVSSGGILVYSIADPTQPRPVDSISLGPNTYWVEVVGSLLYSGNRDGVHVIDASDVHDMHEVGFASTPYSVKRVHYASPFIYVACWDAGVSIIESTQVAVAEPVVPAPENSRPLHAEPNPAVDQVRLVGLLDTLVSPRVYVRDVSGRVVKALRPRQGVDLVIDVTDLPSGLYFVDAVTQKERRVAKFVKQ